MLLLWLVAPFAEPLCPPDMARVHEWAVCLDVARAAREGGVSPRLAVTLAWSESRWRADVESPAGAVGPLQVVPRYWCPGKRRHGCDLTRAGVHALRTLIGRHGAERGLCHYASGNACTPRARRYARHVLALAEARRP